MPTLTRNTVTAKDRLIREILLGYLRLPKKKRDRVDRLFEQLKRSDECEEQFKIATAIGEIVVPKELNITAPAGSTTDLTVGVGTEGKRKVDGYYRNIGETIRARRKALGMTQLDLAEKSGLPQSHISRLEDGLHAPTAKTIERLAKALETEPSKLDILYD